MSLSAVFLLSIHCGGQMLFETAVLMRGSCCQQWCGHVAEHQRIVTPSKGRFSSSQFIYRRYPDAARRRRPLPFNAFDKNSLKDIQENEWFRFNHSDHSFATLCMLWRLNIGLVAWSLFFVFSADCAIGALRARSTPVIYGSLLFLVFILDIDNGSW